jgi:hypothetical protein
MNQVNWSKIVGELNKLADMEKIRSEVNRISQEIRKFDIQAHLSPKAKERLKTVETRYQEIAKTIHRTQRNVDREFSKILRNLKDHRSKAEKSIAIIRKAAMEQKKRIKKASDEIKSRVISATSTEGTGKKSARKRSKKTSG